MVSRIIFDFFFAKLLKNHNICHSRPEITLSYFSCVCAHGFQRDFEGNCVAECPPKTGVPGEWTAWGPCSAAGTQTRSRVCKGKLQNEFYIL